MHITKLIHPELLILEPTIYRDERGYFFEAFNAKQFHQVTGLNPHFVQDNQSRSCQGVLRGLHYQVHEPQAKLVRVVHGRIFDVAVDLRRSSVHFGRWHGVELSAENARQLWIPAGFAHGYVVLSDTAEVVYKATDYYAAEYERCIAWDDNTIKIEWPIDFSPILSHKDAQGLCWADADTYP